MTNPITLEEAARAAEDAAYMKLTVESDNYSEVTPDGEEKRTITGMNDDIDKIIDSVEDVIYNIGFKPVGVFEIGAIVENIQETLKYDGKDWNCVSDTYPVTVNGATPELDSHDWYEIPPVGSTVSTVEDVLKSRAFLGTVISTQGYYSEGDAGKANYLVKSVIDTQVEILDETGAAFTMDSGYYAVLIHHGEVNAAQFGVGVVGVADDAPLVQKAADLMALKGGTVILPFKPTGHPISNITLQAGVTLRGEQIGWLTHSALDWNPDDLTFKSTWIDAIGEVNTPVITLSMESSVQSLRMFDQRQTMSYPELVDSFTDTQIAIQFGYENNYKNYGQSVEDVTFYGFKVFCQQWVGDDGDHQSMEKLAFRRNFGMPFECALDMAHSSDTCWIDDCQFNPTSLRGLRDEDTRANLVRSLSRIADIFRFGQVDGLKVLQTHGLGCRAFVTYRRDAFFGDNNVGGGTTFTGCEVDICHRGIEYFRDGPNGIGISWVTGQIIPITYIEGSENVAVYVENEEAVNGFLQLNLISASLHNGDANPFVNTPQDNFVLGPDSIIAPLWVVDTENAKSLLLNITACQLRCRNYTAMVDVNTACGGTNITTMSQCSDLFGKQVNVTSQNSERDDVLDFYEYTEGGSKRNVEKLSSGETLSQDFVSENGLKIIGSLSEMHLRAGGIANTTDAVKLISSSKTFRPATDDNLSLGLGNYRWSDIYAINSAINTSDEDLKIFEDISEVEKIVALEIKATLRKFKWVSAVEEKGDNARIHFGVGAQSLKGIFEGHGLDAEDYGLFCYDEWGDEIDEDGNIIREAGSGYGVRYTELLAFILSAM